MISRENLTSLLGAFYSNIENISESVIHCERMVADQVYQHYFFDYSDDFLSYDLDNYLKRNIASYYFKNNNALQWNFYIVFLTEQEISDIDRSRIEENLDYARKFIIANTELEAWLKRIYLTREEEANGSISGLGDIWKGILREHKLDCVFSNNVKISDGIDLIIDGKNYIERDNNRTNRQFRENEISIGQLHWLNPIKYREYPKFIEPFTFKEINLIDGANGHGKTSLLEAIELFITGQNHRLGEGDDTCIIEAKFTGDVIPRKFKKDTSLFRERDRVWYNGMDKLRGSDLASHFNKFNFYNTDAAFRLTVNKNEKEIEEAFRDIALGDEVNFLRRQINAYKAKLETEQRIFEKSILQYNEDIKEAQLLLTELRKTSGNEETLIKTLNEKIGQYSIQVNLQGNDLVYLDRLKFSISFLTSVLENINTNIAWLEDTTLDELRNENQLLKDVNTKMAISNEKSAQLTKDINDLNFQQEIITRSEENLNDILRYFADDAYLKLEGHEEKIKLQRAKMSSLNVTEKSYLSLRSSQFAYPEKSIAENEKELIEQLSKDRNALDQIEAELEKSRRNISQVKALLATIKNEGREYLALNSDAYICPLCNSPFKSNAQLQDSILRSLGENAENEDLKGLLTIKSRLEETKNSHETSLSSLHDLQELAKRIELNANQSISQIREQVELILSTIPEEERILNDLERFSKTCQELNLHEDEFRLLNTRFKTLFSDEQLNKSNVERLIGNIAEIITHNRKKLEEIGEISAGSDAELLGEVRIYNPSFTLEDEDLLKKRLELVEHYSNELENLKDLQFDDSKNFSLLLLELKMIMDQIDEIRADFNFQQKESSLSLKANETVKVKTEEKEIAGVKQERISSALETLNVLEREHSEADFLQEFLESNKQEIKDTFLAIHTPKEFTDIKIEDGAIKLHKKNGTISDLMRISTGQRSALALSLFLTLNNKLRNGPNMLLFDDPVSFTDDMNVLSFLDYLRELAISKNTQIFFATANENLSFLFSKKFEVLGDIFNHISLERQE